MRYWKRFKEYWWVWAAAVAVLPVSAIVMASGQVGRGSAGIAIGTIILAGAVGSTFWPSRNEISRKEERQR